MDALAAMIALSLTAITAQSLILLVNQFLSQKKSSMQSMENKIKVNNMICNHFSEPIFVERNPKKTFEYDSDTNTYTVLTEDLKKASMSVPMTGLFKKSASGTEFNPSATSSGAIATLNNKGFLAADQTADGTSSGVFQAHVNDKAPNFNGLNDGSNSVSGNHDYLSQFFDLYSDSHTLVSYQVDMKKMNDANGIGKISKGVIFASRCNVLADGQHYYQTDADNKGSSIDYDHIRGDTSLTDSAWDALSEDKKKKNRTLYALYVLTNPWRPFYFPSRNKAHAQVQCCNIEAQVTFIDDPSDADSRSAVPGCKVVDRPSNNWASIYMIDIKTLDAGDFGEDSIKGFFQNDSSSLTTLKKEDDCDESGDFKYEKVACKKKAAKIYQTKLKDFFTYPVQIEELFELPLKGTYGIQNRDENFALGFVADYMKGSNVVKMNLLAIEDKCSSFLPPHLCKNDIRATGRSREEFFQAKSYSCPFAYRNIKETGTSIPLGISLK